MRELLRDDGFWVALLVALVAAGVVAATHRRGWFVGAEAGAVALVAALVALVATDRDGMLSLAGVILVAAGAELGRRFPGWWTPIACLPGAALLARELDAPVPDWARWACLVAAAVTPVLVAATDRGGPRLLPLLLAMTAIGMWATTPDTEHTRVLAGALVGAAVLTFDRRLRAGPAGTAAITGLMVWAVVIDGYPRRGAVVGGLACFGLAALLPLVGYARAPRQPVRFGALLVVQAAIVAVCSRLAGLRSGALAALAISATAWVLGALVAKRLLPARRR